MFGDVCGATMRRFGYGFDKSYYKNLALEPQG